MAAFKHMLREQRKRKRMKGPGRRRPRGRSLKILEIPKKARSAEAATRGFWPFCCGSGNFGNSVHVGLLMSNVSRTSSFTNERSWNISGILGPEESAEFFFSFLGDGCVLLFVAVCWFKVEIYVVQLALRKNSSVSGTAGIW